MDGVVCKLERDGASDWSIKALPCRYGTHSYVVCVQKHGRERLFSAHRCQVWLCLAIGRGASISYFFTHSDGFAEIKLANSPRKR